MEKTCTQCQVTKLLTEFHKNNTCKDGHISICKLCTSNKDFKFRSTLNSDVSVYFARFLNISHIYLY